MLVSRAELEEIMQAVMRPSAFSAIYDVAESYVQKKLPDHYKPTGKTHQQIQTRIAMIFVQAWQDFLCRDSASEAKAYERDANLLNAAVRIVNQDGQSMFTSRMADIEFQSDKNGSVHMESPAGQRALWSLQDMAKSFREYAQELARDKKNKTFFYCLGRRFRLAADSGLPDFQALSLPTPEQSNNAYDSLLETLKTIAPQRLSEIKTNYRTDYDHGNGAEIRRPMAAGWESVKTGRK